MSVAALQLQLLLAEPGDWLQLLGLGRDGCYRRTCLFVFLSVCLSICLSIYFFLHVFRREGSPCPPCSRAPALGERSVRDSGGSSRVLSFLPGFAGAARCGLPIPSALPGAALCAPRNSDRVSVCLSV